MSQLIFVTSLRWAPLDRTAVSWVSSPTGMVALSLESLGVATALGCIAVLLIPYA